MCCLCVQVARWLRLDKHPGVHHLSGGAAIETLARRGDSSKYKLPHVMSTRCICSLCHIMYQACLYIVFSLRRSYICICTRLSAIPIVCLLPICCSLPCTRVYGRVCISHFKSYSATAYFNQVMQVCVCVSYPVTAVISHSLD